MKISVFIVMGCGARGLFLVLCSEITPDGPMNRIWCENQIMAKRKQAL